MSRRPWVVVAVACLLAGGCAPADRAPTSTATTEPAAPPRSEAAGEETLRTWVNALATGDGASGCAVATPRFRDHVVRQAVALRYVPAGASCADAVAATGRAHRELGSTLRIERVTRIQRLRNDRAYFEVGWVESEEGDGAGFTLVWREDRYLIARG